MHRPCQAIAPAAKNGNRRQRRAGLQRVAPAPLPSAPKDLSEGLSSLFLGVDENRDSREQTVYEREYEAKRLHDGLAPGRGTWVNGVWTEKKQGLQGRRNLHGLRAARRRSEMVRGKWRRLTSRLVLRDVYRTATTRPAPETPLKAPRTDGVSPLGVDEFDPDDPIPDDACAVCLSSLSTGALTLQCGHRFHESRVRGVYAYGQACPMCRDETPVSLTPRRRTDDALYGSPLEDWTPESFRISGACDKCGESIYAGQHRTPWSHTYRCPTPEMNAVLRTLAVEHDWINGHAPPPFRT